MWPFTKSEKWFYGASGAIEFSNCAQSGRLILFFKKYVNSIANIKKMEKQGCYFDKDMIAHYLTEYAKRFVDGVDFSTMNDSAYLSFKKCMNQRGNENVWITYLQGVNHSLYGAPLSVVDELLTTNKVSVKDRWLYDERIFTGDKIHAQNDKTNEDSFNKICKKLVELNIQID